MKVLEHNRAIELRRQGKTFNEIIKEVPVSKGSLSLWLRSVSLSRPQVDRIAYKNEIIKKKFIAFNAIKKKEADTRKIDILNSAKNEVAINTYNELKLTGIALYWAEGYKSSTSRGVEFTNSDSFMIALMMEWFRKICGVGEGRFRLRIQLHDPKCIASSTQYWSGITGVPIAQFTKPYIKISPTSKRKMRQQIPNGVCSIRVSDINLLNRIKGWIRGFTALSSSLV